MNFRSSFFSLLTVACLLMLGLTSCGDIEQSLKINPDGSGTLETTFDIGEMMSMVKGFGDIGAEDVTVTNDQEPDTLLQPEVPKDPMELLMDKVTDPEYGRDFDTLISFLSIMPDSVRAKETRPDLVNKISIRMQSPAYSSDLKVGLVMNFENQAQLQELIQYLETMDQNSSLLTNTSPGGIQKETFMSFQADMEAGWIKFDSVDYTHFTEDMGMSGDSLMSGEDMGMLEMMLGSTKIKSTVYVPGEVISCTNPDAVITKDDRVIVEYGLMDAIKQKKIPGYTIHFTPKK